MEAKFLTLFFHKMPKLKSAKQESQCSIKFNQINGFLLLLL